MVILSTSGFPDYELIDSGNGNRLERWGDFKIKRPDPQVLWQPYLSESKWNNIDAVFEKGESKKEGWTTLKKVPESWTIRYKHLKLKAKLTPFKHTGIFPEQHLNWDWMYNLLSDTQRPPRVLNLFAYTGIASIVCASAGAHVTHVDASKPSITWASENQQLSGLADKPIRWIFDDVSKFVQREVRREAKYDAIIMDPPVYGHGPNGEPWDFMKDFPPLLEATYKLLSDKPCFVLVNAYAISASAITLENMMRDYFAPLKGTLESGELCLKESHESARMLSTGIFARWYSK